MTSHVRVTKSSGHVLGIDIDDGAIDLSLSNISIFNEDVDDEGLLPIDLLRSRVVSPREGAMAGGGLFADTVVMNPPFGEQICTVASLCCYPF